jgi:hypothetical protein
MPSAFDFVRCRAKSGEYLHAAKVFRDLETEPQRSSKIHKKREGCLRCSLTLFRYVPSDSRSMSSRNYQAFSHQGGRENIQESWYSSLAPIYARSCSRSHAPSAWVVTPPQERHACMHVRAMIGCRYTVVQPEYEART